MNLRREGAASTLRPRSRNIDRVCGVGGGGKGVEMVRRTGETPQDRLRQNHRLERGEHAMKLSHGMGRRWQRRPQRRQARKPTRDDSVATTWLKLRRCHMWRRQNLLTAWLWTPDGRADAVQATTTEGCRVRDTNGGGRCFSIRELRRQRRAAATAMGPLFPRSAGQARGGGGTEASRVSNPVWRRQARNLSAKKMEGGGPTRGWGRERRRAFVSAPHRDDSPWLGCFRSIPLGGATPTSAGGLSMRGAPTSKVKAALLVYRPSMVRPVSASAIWAAPLNPADQRTSARITAIHPPRAMTSVAD